MFTANGEMPNVFDLVKRFVWSKFNIYKALRMLVSTIGFLANVILPYFLLSKFTKKTNASYHRQTYSYMPFMILDFEQVPVPTDELAGTEFAASAKKVEDINVLTSFNRYIAFMVSKVAMKAVYSTVHAAYSPAGYLEQLNKRDNAAAGYNVAGA
ncbi:Skp1-related protein [Babesia caballi]|uniref:Skp1-related protein n=1 Tax=Babesia caballi TaxID=5871 RepID=A0AAV4LZT8_BABCB|nr:Skp1-related protein [Babesia caballi]